MASLSTRLENGSTAPAVVFSQGRARQTAGYRSQLADNLAVPQYACLKHGDDDGDAQHLAGLMRPGLLPTACIYPRAQQPLRDLLRRRRRMLLAQQSVRLLQTVEGYRARTTGQRLGENAFRHLTRRQLADTFVEPTELFVVVSLIQTWRALQEKITAMESWLAADTRHRADLLLRLLTRTAKG